MRRRLITTFSICLILLLAVLAIGLSCAGPAPEQILIGNPASLTGMFAGFGEGQVFGMKAAVGDINKQGGVYVQEYGKKLPIKLIVVNSESDPLFPIPYK